MSIKKSVAATVVAVGLTVTASGSYASSAPEGGASEAVQAQRVTERAAVNEERAQTAADRTVSSADAAKRKCVAKKKIKKLRVFQKYNRVMNRLPKATYKNTSGGLRFRSFNACTSSLDTDLDLVFKKLKKKWRVYEVSVFWG